MKKPKFNPGLKIVLAECAGVITLFSANKIGGGAFLHRSDNSSIFNGWKLSISIYRMKILGIDYTGKKILFREWVFK
jgi:hypothetical protein